MDLLVISSVVAAIALIFWLIFYRRRRDNAWLQFAGEIGGEFVAGNFSQQGRVKLQVGDATITLSIEEQFYGLMPGT